MAVTCASAAGVISLLDEPNDQLKCVALHKLDSLVNSFWMQIADVLMKIEKLYEDGKFPERNLAALVASKVYFHLGSYEDALLLALGAGDLFDVHGHSEYIDKIIGTGIDHYTKIRTMNAESKDSQDKKSIDPRLEEIVNKTFERCFAHKRYRQAIGIALETRRLDIVERAIKQSGSEASSHLAYCVQSTLAWQKSRQYRQEVLRALVALYSLFPQPDYINMAQCLIFLEDSTTVADILITLIKSEDTNKTLLAYQIAFDLYENATQQFILNVLQALGPKVEPKSETNESSVETQSEASDKMETEQKKSEELKEPTSSTSAPEVPLTQDGQNMKQLKQILSGEETIRLHLQFLIRKNKTDMLILKNMKDIVRNSVAHTSAVIANCFMHVSTTCDDFLRDNLEWVSKATNWSKFSAVASLGVIHKGHESDAMRLMENYLPKTAGAAGSSGYMEGGGLYGLGMIFANHGDETVIQYLKNQLASSTLDNVRHGACLGLGLAAMGSHKQAVYEALKGNLFQDDAVTGEAAGLAMGLVMLGSKSTQAIEDMVAYAQETQHEKILRGLCVGISLLMYGRLEEAEALIESLLRDKDPLLRRSGVYSIAMAYCGTGQKEALRRLLHLAVSDVNDDVRRAAVTSLGFILFRTPDQCPAMVSLLAESYNPHVRYGAALALGISCAGTANKEAIALLDPMMNDAVNYVRQGALMALALIMIQQNEFTCPKVKEFRTHLTKVIGDKHEDTITKYGAIISQGILDAGGRNVTVSLLSRNGQTDVGAVVGMLVFLQHWYWFPLTHFLALAFRPTCLIGLTGELKIPKIEFESKARPSLYSYAPPLEEKKDDKKEKVETAILSITAKAKKKERQRQGTSTDSKSEEKMEVDEAEPEKKEEEKKDATESKESKDEAKEEKDKDGKEKPKEKEPEPTFEMVENPARVMKQQLKVVSLPAGSRYQPMKNVSVGGIIMLMDRRPDEEMEFIVPVKISAGGVKKEEEEKEPEPPEAFEFKPENY